MNALRDAVNDLITAYSNGETFMELDSRIEAVRVAMAQPDEPKQMRLPITLRSDAGRTLLEKVFYVRPGDAVVITIEERGEP